MDLTLIISLGIFLVCVAYGSAVWAKSNKVKTHYNLKRGMTFSQIVIELGEPFDKVQSGQEIECRWKKTLDGKEYILTVIFENGQAKMFK